MRRTMATTENHTETPKSIKIDGEVIPLAKTAPPPANTSRGFWSSITTDDRWDFDPIIVSILVAVAFSILLQSYSVFRKDQPFDPEKFGNGIAFILGAGGVGYGAKRFGEKQHRGDNDGDSSSS